MLDSEFQRLPVIPQATLPEVSDFYRTKTEEQVSRLNESGKRVSVTKGVVIRGEVTPELRQLLRRHLQAEGIEIYDEKFSDLSELSNVKTGDTIVAGRIQVTRQDDNRYSVELRIGSRFFIFNHGEKAQSKLLINPDAPDRELSVLGSTAVAALSSHTDWIQHLNDLKERSTYIGAGDKLVSLDPQRALSPSSVERLKRVMQGGIIRLAIEDDEGSVKILNIYPSTLETFKKGGLRINGRVLQSSFERSITVGMVEDVNLSSACVNTQFRITHLSRGSHLPYNSGILTDECSGADLFSRNRGFSPYRIPLKGLQDAELDQLIIHRPYVKTPSGEYSISGESDLSKMEQKTAQDLMSGAHNLERYFGIEKGGVVRQLVLPPNKKFGPHVIYEIQPFAIQVPAQNLAVMSGECAQAIGRHEAAHIIDSIFQVTFRPGSTLATHHAKMKGVSQDYFRMVDESHIYGFTGGHSIDNPQEYFASLVNSVCHPKIDDILRRSSLDFRANYLDGLKALYQDLETAGFQLKKIEIGKRISGLITRNSIN